MKAAEMEQTNGRNGLVQRLGPPVTAQDEAPGAHRLPPEMWIEIFRNLRPRDLTKVRLTCRMMNEIISSSLELMKSYRFRLMHHIDRVQLRAIAASRNRICRSQLCWVSFEYPGICYWFLPLWKTIGQRITQLDVEHCDITISFLVQILRHTPNLRQLTFFAGDPDSLEIIEKLDIDFVLTNLLELTIYVELSYLAVLLLEMFQKVCGSRLKELDLSITHGPTPESEGAILNFMRTFSKTLENITSDATESIIRKLLKIPGLVFKQVELSESISDETIILLSRNVPTIESLILEDTALNSFETLFEIGKNLTNLKLLSCNVSNSTCRILDFSFLKSMPKLKKLCLYQFNDHSYMLWTKSYQCSSPNLEHLELAGVYLSQHVLLSYLRQSPRIRRIALLQCCVEYSTDIVMLVTQLKSVQHFKLSSTSFVVQDSVDFRNNVGFSNVKNLELFMDKVDNSKSIIVTLLKLCPALTVLALSKCADDDLVCDICKVLEKLKVLKLFECYVTKDGLERMVKNQCNVAILEEIWIHLRESNDAEKEAVIRILREHNSSAAVTVY